MGGQRRCMGWEERRGRTVLGRLRGGAEHRHDVLPGRRRRYRRVALLEELERDRGGKGGPSGFKNLGDAGLQ